MREKRTLLKWLLIFQMVWMPLVLMAKPNPVKNIELSNGTNSVSVCARAYHYSYNDIVSDVKPYIKIVPKQTFTAKNEYGSVCLKGLKPSTHYTITFHKDMPLGSTNLAEDYRFEVTTLAYEPGFSFPEEGYILPTKGEISIPVETTNVKQLQISLYRINNRNLIESVNSYGLLRSLSSYKLDDIESRDGYKLWTKNLTIRKNALNEAFTTAIPVGDFLKKRKPGVYILSADMLDEQGEVIYTYNADTQWFMVSDIGLYTLKSDRGLTVLTKKLSDAKPYKNVRLELIARNNEILETKVSKNGKVFFPARLLNGQGGLEAKAIYAYGKNDDFTVIDLGKSAHDLSDRGVEGRKSPGFHDAFIYSNRGIFRPGEQMDFHALVRDKLGVSQAGVPVSVKVFDSREVTVYTKQFKTDDLGHLADTLNISETASTGKWRLALYAGSDTATAQYSFLVEDFVPPKIKVELAHKVETIKLEGNTTISIAAKYLNGEALPKAYVEINTIIHKVPYPVKKYSHYSFGDITEKFRNKTLKMRSFKTDEEGKLDIPFAVSKTYDTSFPLSAHIDISVNELGGRPVHKILNVLYENQDRYIGVKPNFENDAIDMDKYAKFNVVYLKDQKLTEETLTYEIIEESAHWHWRTRNGSWEYYKTYSDEEVIQSGSFTSNSREPSVLTLKKLDWGNYRLEVKDKNNVITTYRFTSGYEESSSKSSPDRLPVSIDKQSYRVGDKLRVNIKPKFSGPVVIYIAHDDLLESKTIQAHAGKRSEVTFKVKSSWGSSAYVLATAFRAQSKKLGANRAIGLAPVKISHPEQEIHLSMQYTEKTTSNSKVKVTLRSKDAKRRKTHFTLAAVDEGVLNLTAFKVPDPVAYFLGQRKLGIEIRDIYADLIKARGAHAQFNVGSDEALAQAIRDDVTTNKREVVALFTKELTFNKNGVAEVALEIPDYQGALRLMALAWNKKATGSAEGELIVKDAISIEYYMPLFISVGDKVETLFTIDFDNTIQPGAYEIRVRTQGGIALDHSTFSVTIEKNKTLKFSKKLVMDGKKKEDGTVIVDVLKDGKVMKTKRFEIAVRSTYPETYVRNMGMLKSQQALTAANMVDTSLWTAPESLSLKVSAKPILPVEALKGELYYYPWRCAEQTTSRAMPWLFSKKKTEEQKEIIPKAIERLLTYQNVYGGFGLWYSSRRDMWVSAYVMDFLTRAKKAGYAVPKQNIDLGLNWIENQLERWSNNGYKQEADAYGLYVLTRNGRILMSELKYHANAQKSQIRSAQAWAHLAASFAYVGEKKLAQKMFEKAKHALGNNYNGWYYSNYGGALRDEASLIALMIESKVGNDWENLLGDLALKTQKESYLSTQEMSVLLRIALELGDAKDAKLKLSVNNVLLPLGKEIYRKKAATLAELPTVKNVGSSNNWYDLSFKATPNASYYHTQNDNGFSISKTIYTMEGEKVDLAKIAQNKRLVVVLTGKIENTKIDDPLITDWLIAGFELENPSITGIDPTSTLKWLGKQTKTEHLAYRNDRFAAALDMTNEKTNEFKIAYVVRAVSAGRFALAPAKIEDMYQPRYRAFSQFFNEKVKIGQVSQTVVQQAAKVDNNMTKKEKPEDKNKPTILTEQDYLDVYDYPVTDLSKYTIVQLNFLRNSIFAHAGLSFEKSNPMLHQRFTPYSWYKPTSDKSSIIYKQLSPQREANVQALLKEEKRRGGGLVLSDFYRVNHRLMTEESLKKYDKASLRILRNSLFARYGLSFKKSAPELDTIYAYMPWYKPNDSITVSQIFDEQMSEMEKANILLMIKMGKTK